MKELVYCKKIFINVNGLKLTNIGSKYIIMKSKNNKFLFLYSLNFKIISTINYLDYNEYFENVYKRRNRIIDEI